MAKKNIPEYERIINLLDKGLYIDKDGFVRKDDIVAMFIAISDKVRKETIDMHINNMCKIKFLIKRSDELYEINPKWKELVKFFS